MFNADDLMFFFDKVLGNKELRPAFDSWLAPGGTPVKAEKVDDYTVRFTFALPGGVFILQLASYLGYDMTMYPEHYCKQFHVDFVDKAKLEATAKAAGFEFWYQLFGNKTGGNATKNLPAYPHIHAWGVTIPAPAQPVVMERNPYYYKVDKEGNQLPYIDKVEHIIVESAAVVNLRAIQAKWTCSCAI